MKVQLLSFPGCPNVDAARTTLRDVLVKHRLAASIEEVCTTAPDAPAHLRGWGSRTILIDGVLPLMPACSPRSAWGSF